MNGNKISALAFALMLMLMPSNVLAEQSIGQQMEEAALELGLDDKVLANNIILYLWGLDMVPTDINNGLVAEGSLDLNDHDDYMKVMKALLPMMENMSKNNDFSKLKALFKNSPDDLKVIEVFEQLFINVNDYSEGNYMALTGFLWGNFYTKGASINQATEGNRIIMFGSTMLKAVELWQQGKMDEVTRDATIQVALGKMGDYAAIFFYSYFNNCHMEGYNVICPSSQALPGNKHLATSDPIMEAKIDALNKENGRQKTLSTYFEARQRAFDSIKG